MYRHAPLITKSNKSSRTTLSPSITSEIIKLKSSRRRLERTYISSHSLLDFKILRTATNCYHRAISAAKKVYFSSRILSSLSNPRTLWKNINHILHRNINRTLPTSSPLSSLPQLFATYFSDKITKLYFNLQSNPSTTPIHLPPPSPLVSSSPLPLPHYWKLPTLCPSRLIHPVVSTPSLQRFVSTYQMQYLQPFNPL